MRVLGIDPGPVSSAVVVWDGAAVLHHAITPNEEVLGILQYPFAGAAYVVIEQVHMGGMVAGAETFDTALMAGRFFQQVYAHQTYRNPDEPRWVAHLMKRQDVKRHHLGQVRGNDAQLRAALIDRFGPYKETALGTKRAPGVFYGVKSHEWAALAIAIAWHDQWVPE